MEIHYESLCPDSVRFISLQLAPQYETFKKHLEITFIPFGKSNVSYEIFGAFGIFYCRKSEVTQLISLDNLGCNREIKN